MWTESGTGEFVKFWISATYGDGKEEGMVVRVEKQGRQAYDRTEVQPDRWSELKL